MSNKNNDHAKCKVLSVIMFFLTKKMLTLTKFFTNEVYGDMIFKAPVQKWYIMLNFNDHERSGQPIVNDYLKSIFEEKSKRDDFR